MESVRYQGSFARTFVSQLSRDLGALVRQGFISTQLMEWNSDLGKATFVSLQWNKISVEKSLLLLLWTRSSQTERTALHRRHGSPRMNPAGEEGKQSGTAATGLSTCDTTGCVTPWLWEKCSGKLILGPSQPSAWPYCCTHGPKLQSWDIGFWNCPYYLGMRNTGFGSSLFLVVREVRVCSVSIAKKKIKPYQNFQRHID